MEKIHKKQWNKDYEEEYKKLCKEEKIDEKLEKIKL